MRVKVARRHAAVFIRDHNHISLSSLLGAALFAASLTTQSAHAWPPLEINKIVASTTFRSNANSQLFTRSPPELGSAPITVTGNIFNALSKSQQSLVIFRGVDVEYGPSNTVSVRHLGVRSEASSTAGGSFGDAQVTFSGTYKLTEDAQVSLEIFQHSIIGYAASGTARASEGIAQTYTSFEINPFEPPPDKFVHSQGEILTAAVAQIRGTKTPEDVGPRFRTAFLRAGEYHWMFTEYTRAQTAFTSTALSEIRNAGFRLSVIDEAESIFVFLAGVLSVYCLHARVRAPREKGAP